MFRQQDYLNNTLLAFIISLLASLVHLFAIYNSSIHHCEQKLFCLFFLLAGYHYNVMYHGYIFKFKILSLLNSILCCRFFQTYNKPFSYFQSHPVDSILQHFVAIPEPDSKMPHVNYFCPKCSMSLTVSISLRGPYQHESKFNLCLFKQWQLCPSIIGS